MLSPMRYKTFTWPHNPRTYEISYERVTALHKVPLGQYQMQDLGRTCRVLRGSGEFYGPDAYDTFRALATVFYDTGAGPLFHPVWQTSHAYFTDLKLRMEPRSDYVAYSFTFVEGYFQYGGMKRLSASSSAGAAAAPKSGAAVYHTVVSGDTLWGICAAAGKTLAQILALNPEISNPNFIRVGQKVRTA